MATASASEEDQTVESVTTVVKAHIKPGKEQEYEQWLHGINEDATQFASGLVALFVPDSFNDSGRKDKGHIDWTGDGDHDLNANPITTLPSKNLSTLDGYWVFLNTTRFFSKQLIV